MTTELASRCYADLYSSLFWASVGEPERYGHKPQQGQRSLFGDEPDAPAAPGEHDVSQEARDASGQWTASGKSEESAAPAVDPPASVATIGQDEPKPASGETAMPATDYVKPHEETMPVFKTLEEANEWRKANPGAIGNQDIKLAFRQGTPIEELNVLLKKQRTHRNRKRGAQKGYLTRQDNRNPDRFDREEYR